MLIQCGSKFDLLLPQPTPIVALLKVHPSREGDLDMPEQVWTTPDVPVHSYIDPFGNWCSRMLAPAGPFSIRSKVTVRDHGLADPQVREARQLPVEALPDEMLTWLIGSRYCDTDLLSDTAWNLFQNTAPGWERVQAICDFVHNHIQFDYQRARATRSASEAYYEQVGVCRDFTHLAITFCRCMNIPARYCTGYLGDIGMPPPYPPGDFAAWMEVWLDGNWWTFDPRNNVPRIGRVLVARGRDAADVPLIHSFGMNTLTGFEVWSDEIVEGSEQVQMSA